MLSSDGDTDVFFDSEDCLPSEESFVSEEVDFSKLGYDIWMSEPQSIKKRRERFLQEVGFVEFASPRTCAQDSEIESSGDSSGRMELERLSECSGAVSSSGCVPSCNVEYNDLEVCHNEMQSVEFDDEATSRSFSVSDSSFQRCQGEANIEGCKDIDVGTKKMKSWWKSFKNKAARRTSTELAEESKSNPAKSKSCRTKVYQNKKRCSEFSALYMRQQICAHKGLIWTMKFSPDGKYLASGGEDGVVRIWRITSANASREFLANDRNYNKPIEGKSSFSSKPSRFATVVIPEKVFQIDESPVQEFHGHSSDVLDIAWSNSNCLLSASKDKTVRLWQVGSDQCLNVFHHKNYVTCIQFNPMNENHFISGSIDGKIRIWSVSKQRVVDWADVRDVITALSYRPDGKGFAVGSITGTCRFYETSGDYLHLDAEINVQGRKKASGKRITGIQFCRDNSERVMITSEDSKVRIFEGTEIVNKFKGLPKSGSQMSASFTKNGKHILSVGEDSRVYMWNYDSLRLRSTKETKSQQSSEHFFSDGASVAIPWPGIGTEPTFFSDNQAQFSQRQDYQGAASWTRDSERFSLGNWFSVEGLCRGSATWPEERLPLWDLPVADDEHGNLQHLDHHQKNLNGQSDAHDHDHVSPPEPWGLVIVVAGLDGTIKTFHNYGLPISL